MSLTPAHTKLLRRTLGLAIIARESGNPPFGSLLADEHGTIVREETNTTLTGNDITAHPELKLARWAATRPASLRTSLTMFTSCQPCPMCMNAIGRAAVPRVIYALSVEQLEALKSPGASTVFHPFTADGPHLSGESGTPVQGYY